MTEEKFDSPGSRVVGVIGIVAAVGIAVDIAANGPGPGGFVAIFVAALWSALCWVYLFRPQLRLTETTLTLRNPLGSVAVPLQLVKSVNVRRLVVITLVDDVQLTSTAMSRGTRDLQRLDMGRAPAAVDDAGFMATRVEHQAQDARRRAPEADVAVRRTPAWPEIACLAISTVGLVVALLLWL